MDIPEPHDIDETPSPAREGLFDDQLSLPGPFVGGPQPITTIIKRDGREAPFDKAKIAEAIAKAAQSIGVDDRMLADSLASGVSLYLSKKLHGAPPTVEQVQDAVERVLIELGHGQIALAYARYRDRRARIRRLRSGDPRQLLSELDEARHGARPGPGLSLFVRTGEETLAEWDREKIVQALVRETNIETHLAELIAYEVEQQIGGAKVKTLTTSLVRELVDAKLVEYGQEEHHRRHRRLGVPLFDAQEIICTPNLRTHHHACDPAASDRILAERVKKEFALTQVFSQPVADAHLGGDIHVQGLGYIDRFHSAGPSMEFIKKFGAALPVLPERSRPPKHANTLLAQLFSFNAVLENHFSAALEWQAVNVFLAPFLIDFDEQALTQAAQMLVSGFAYRSFVHGGGPEVARTLRICWDVPDDLKSVEAIGPGSAYTGRTYGEYLHTVQRIAWTLMDVYRESDGSGPLMPTPAPVICITPTFFKSPGSDGFLRQAASVAAQGHPVRFALERHPPAPAASAAWPLRDITAQEVVLNLPRTAYRAKSEAAVYGELDRLLESAVQAHLQKREFMARLLSLQDSGPLSLLSTTLEGLPYLNVDEVCYRVALDGLNECVQCLVGQELHESEAALALAQRLVAHLHRGCETWRDREDLQLVLTQPHDRSSARRFAMLDLHHYSEQARHVVKSDPAQHEVHYTPSCQLNGEHPMSPMERIRQEGRLHAWMSAGTTSAVTALEADLTKESLADFVEKSYFQTTANAILFPG